MSFGDLAIHTSQVFFYNLVKTGEASRSPAPTWNTLDDVKQIVHDRTEETKAIYASLTESDLHKTVEVPQMNMSGPGVMYLTVAKDHEVHHKGQLFVYARLMGAKEVPFFVSR